MAETKIYDLTLARRCKQLEAEATALRSAIIETIRKSQKYCSVCSYDLSPKRPFLKMFLVVSYIFFLTWFLLSVLF